MKFNQKILQSPTPNDHPEVHCYVHKPFLSQQTCPSDFLQFLQLLTHLPCHFSAVPKSASRLSPPTGPRTPLQTAKASGVIYSVPEANLTPPTPPPRSPSKTTPPRGIRGATVHKNRRSLAQEVTKREQSPAEYGREFLQSPVSPSRLRYAIQLMVWFIRSKRKII